MFYWIRSVQTYDSDDGWNYISNLKFMQEVFRNRGAEGGHEQNGVSLSDDAKIRIKNAIRSAKNAVLLAVLVNTIV